MSKRENVWNQLLFEKSRQGGFVNKNLLILGRKGSGKRSVIDALAEVSKTKQCTLRIKSTTPIIDYTYLNLIDLRDPDYTTNARLNVYILEEEAQKYLLPRILNHRNIRNTFVVIALDLQEPWTFMEDLDRWVSVLQDLLAELKLNLQELEDMKANITQYVGDVKINLGLPLMVLVNKSDILEREDKGKDWDSKAEVIQYCLREFCVNYGATLLFTSVKQKINIQIMYEYVLHRLYGMPIDMSHKNLSDVESLFIPLGQDDLNIIKSTFTKLANQTMKYEEQVPVVLSKKVNFQQTQNQPKDELVAEEDQEFFGKLKEKSQQAPASKPILPIVVPQKTDEQPALSARGGAQNIQLKEFYDKILTGKSDPMEKGAVQHAQQQLHERLKQTKAETTIVKSTTLFNAQDQQKLQKILPTMSADKNLEALLKKGLNK